MVSLTGILFSIVSIVLLVIAVLLVAKGLFELILSITGYKLKKKDSTGSSKVKHVIITGGSSGIGLELARAYLEKNYKVTIVARDLKKLQQAKIDLIDSVSKTNHSKVDDVSKNLEIISCDISGSEEAVQKAFNPIVEKHGGVDILVNCAGTSIAGVFEDLPVQEFERMHRVNVLGSIYSTRFVVPLMKQQRSGQIIFVASQVAQAAIHGYTAYAASKWALRGLAEALQMEVKPFNISVSVSYPPDTNTPGYAEEMLSKPSLTKTISESGQVFSPSVVARDIIRDADEGYFTISTGFDGWLIKQLHPGMSPMNNISEVVQQVLFASIARLIAVFYLLYWDFLVAKDAAEESKKESKKIK